MAVILGIDCIAYRSAALIAAAGSAAIASATWLEVAGVKDVTVSSTRTMPDVTTRANNGIKQFISGIKDLEVSIEFPYDPTDDDYIVLETAYNTGAAIAMLFLDGPSGTTGSRGYGGNFAVGSFSRAESNEEAAMISITLKPHSFNSFYIKEA